jgi:predicted lipoprotein with Yx(FWY)xxD motif
MPAHARPSLLVVVALATAALALALGGTTAGAATLKVSTAQNATLGKRILVTSTGRTLYTLSAETRGRFICKDRSCLATWPPLVLARGARPVGVRSLGVIRRPDGRRQVTYKGRPLYRFASDRKKGDVKGEGFVDVGTWHAAVVSR